MPVGVQCPISSSLGEFPSYWDWFRCPGLSPVWCPSPFPSLSILGVYHSLLSAIGFQSCFFFTADVSPPIRSTLHSLTFYVSFQAWDWLWYPMLWSQRRTTTSLNTCIHIVGLLLIDFMLKLSTPKYIY